MHKLLQRQLRRCFNLDPDSPIPESCKALIDAVNEAYEQADADRLLLERSLELSSRELLQANRELEEAIAKLIKTRETAMRAEKLAAVGRIASSVSHELRNPLGAIKNAVYYIRDSLQGSSLINEDPDLKEFLDMADKEINRASVITGDLLNFSQVKKLELNLTNVGKLLSFTLKNLTVPSGVVCVENYSKDIPLILADPLRLRQVFINFITNAFQAMPDGGVLTLSTRLDAQARGLEVQIRDTGVGIPRENLAKIFEPLFTTKGQGTGLGLTICMEIIEAHGGRVSVESEAGKETAFTIHLNLASGAERADDDLHKGGHGK